MPKRLHGFNPDGNPDSVIGESLPEGWTSSDPNAAEAPEEAPKPRGRPPKVQKPAAETPEEAE